MASNNKKEVRSDSTNPTPLAALKRAIFLIADTVYMLEVKQSAYIPIANKRNIGTLVIGDAGSKNQKIPTPSVNIMGKIKDNNVQENFSPSLSDQTKRRSVIKLKAPMPKKRYLSSKNWIPKKPKVDKTEVIINLFLLFIKVCYSNFESKSSGISRLV